MQQTLKAIMGSSTKRQPTSDQSNNGTARKAVDQAQRNYEGASLGEQVRVSSVASHGDALDHSRSRPLSSVYDDRYMHDALGSQLNPHDPSISKDRNTYPPVGSPSNNTGDDQHRKFGREQGPNVKESRGRHEEAVADRNMHTSRASQGSLKRKPVAKSSGM